MKFGIVFLSLLILLLCGCGLEIPPDKYHEAEKACEQFGGLKSYCVMPGTDAHCIDGTQIYFP